MAQSTSAIAPQSAAHDVVVVVAHPRLVARDRPCRLDPAYEPGVGEGAEDVVDRLVGHLAEVTAYGADHCLGVRVRVGVEGAQHRQARPRHAETGDPEQLLQLVQDRGPKSSRPTLVEKLERVKIVNEGDVTSERLRLPDAESVEARSRPIAT